MLVEGRIDDESNGLNDWKLQFYVRYISIYDVYLLDRAKYFQ